MEHLQGGQITTAQGQTFTNTGEESKSVALSTILEQPLVFTRMNKIAWMSTLAYLTMVADPEKKVIGTISGEVAQTWSALKEQNRKNTDQITTSATQLFTQMGETAPDEVHEQVYTLMWVFVNSIVDDDQRKDTTPPTITSVTQHRQDGAVDNAQMYFTFHGKDGLMHKLHISLNATKPHKMMWGDSVEIPAEGYSTLSIGPVLFLMDILAAYPNVKQHKQSLSSYLVSLEVKDLFENLKTPDGTLELGSSSKEEVERLIAEKEELTRNIENAFQIMPGIFEAYKEKIQILIQTETDWLKEYNLYKTSLDTAKMKQINKLETTLATLKDNQAQKTQYENELQAMKDKRSQIWDSLSHIFTVYVGNTVEKAIQILKKDKSLAVEIIQTASSGGDADFHTFLTNVTEGLKGSAEAAEAAQEEQPPLEALVSKITDFNGKWTVKEEEEPANDKVIEDALQGLIMHKNSAFAVEDQATIISYTEMRTRALDELGGMLQAELVASPEEIFSQGEGLDIPQLADSAVAKPAQILYKAIEKADIVTLDPVPDGLQSVKVQRINTTLPDLVPPDSMQTAIEPLALENLVKTEQSAIGIDMLF